MESIRICAAAWDAPAAGPGGHWLIRLTRRPPIAPACGGEASRRSSRSRKIRRLTGATAAAPEAVRPVFDAGRYKERDTVERCMNKLKAFRAVATRYGKRERICQGTVDVASIRIWLRDPVP
jgi:hypothetical protein